MKLGYAFDARGRRSHELSGTPVDVPSGTS